MWSIRSVNPPKCERVVGEGEYLLVLGAEQSLRERGVIAAVRAFPGMIFAVTPKAVLGKNRHFDHTLSANPVAPEEVLQAVVEFEKCNNGLKPCAVVTLNEWTLETARAISDHYNLPFHSQTTITNCRNKQLMKICFESNNLPCAKSKRISSKDELSTIPQFLPFPVVLKPIDFGGSGGVRKANNPEELAEAYQAALTHTSLYAATFRISNESFLIEEYIESDVEVSVEVLCTKAGYAIVSVTDKYLGPEPHFAEIGHLVPSHLNHSEKIRKLAESACAACGIELGMAHVEMRIDKKGNPILIEVAARSGGDVIMDLCERTYGTNPYELHILSFLDPSPAFGAKLVDHVQKAKATCASAVAFLCPEQGRVLKIHSPDSLPPSVINLYITGQIGMESKGQIDWSSRFGMVEFRMPITESTAKNFTHIDIAKNLSSQIFEMEKT
jgi:biotin carboxylase